LTSNEFGRVDDKNNVYVIDGGTERLVGQYPDVTSEEAMAFFTKKFDDLEAQVRILEQRIASGITDVKSLKATHSTLVKDCTEPKAVGNLASLRQRLEAVQPAIAQAAEKASAAREEAIAQAMKDKEEIAARAEAIVANLGGINWKKSAAEMTELFDRWQAIQKDGPKVPKAKTDPIWKRFSQSRAKFESGRRAYFSTLDSSFKEAKKVKSDLVARAEALVSKGAKAAGDYKALQEQWKAAGKAGKAEESLWKSFRAAGDAIFSAKKEQDAELATEHKANLEKKLELLKLAEAIRVEDLDKAKKALSDIQAAWSRIGHVPKDQIKIIESRLRAVEAKVSDAQKEAWQRSDPAAKARSNSLATQLEGVIAVLEAELSSAPAAKKKEIQAQIDSRKALLEAAQNAVD
jgi:hypothetical protein